jgi:hypothetical protein
LKGLLKVFSQASKRPCKGLLKDLQWISKHSNRPKALASKIRNEMKQAINAHPLKGMVVESYDKLLWSLSVESLENYDKLLWSLSVESLKEPMRTYMELWGPISRLVVKVVWCSSRGFRGNPGWGKRGPRRLPKT